MRISQAFARAIVASESFQQEIIGPMIEAFVRRLERPGEDGKTYDVIVFLHGDPGTPDGTAQALNAAEGSERTALQLASERLFHLHPGELKSSPEQRLVGFTRRPWTA